MKLNIQLFAEGKVIIETDLDTKQFDQKMSKLEAKYKTAEIDLKIKTSNFEDAKQDMNEANRLLGEIKRKRDEINKQLEPKQKELNAINELIRSNGALQPSQYLAMGRLENEVSRLKPLQQEVNAEFEKQNEIMNQAVDNYVKAEASYNKQLIKVEQINKEISEINNKTTGINLGNIEKSINKIGNSITKVTKKVGKWALAVFGIRSAYLFVRSAMSTLSQYDDQLAVNVEYIRYLLANTVKPIVEYIVNLAYKLLNVVNSIIKALFGIDLLASASTDQFMKQRKAMGGTAKSAKELKNYLTGFDEMNVIPSTQDTSKGYGSEAKNNLLPNFKDVTLPKWLPTLLSILTGVAVALKLIKLNIKSITAFGIGAIIAGVLMLITDIVNMIKDPSWQNFIKILGDIAIIIGGIMLVMGNWWGLLVVLAGLTVKLIAENWDKVKTILSKIGSWIYDNIIKPVAEFFEWLWGKIVDGVNYSVDTLKSVFGTIANWFNNFVIKPIANIFTGLWEMLKTGATGAWNVISTIFKTAGDWFKNNVIQPIYDAFEWLWSGIKGVINLLISGFNVLIRGINKLSFDVPDWVPVIGGNKWGFNIPEIPKLAKGTILNNPGKGVPVAGGRALAGEAGPEAYLPLTDNQLLEELGSTIGKYITINANITNTMNGRVISKELQKINAENDFAYNR